MKVLTLLINLDGSNDRLESATQILHQQNISFERIAAYDGRGKSLEQFTEYDDNRAKDFMGRSLLSAEIGCYLSHVRCVEALLKSDAEYAIVLEDDMNLVSDFHDVITEMLEYLHSHQEIDWHLINIGPKKRKLTKTIQQFKHYDLARAYYFPIRTIGLVWSRKGAQKFLDDYSNIYAPIDNYLQLWLSTSAKGLSVWAPLVYPSGFESEIDKTRSMKDTAEKKSFSLKYKRQARMWSIRIKSIKNMFFN